MQGAVKRFQIIVNEVLMHAVGCFFLSNIKIE